MANSWFEFKQFRINQDKTAMKVGTDGVLLGSWIDVENAVNALDIGTGTGLLALMIAQRSREVRIDAIDIDKGAYEQARENTEASPWSDRLDVFHNSLKEFSGKSEEKYDLIVCNPPYFTNGVKSDDEKRSIARHADELTLDELFKYSSQLLSDIGNLGIIFPYTDFDRTVLAAKNRGLYPKDVLYVKPIIDKDFVRVLISFSRIDIGSFNEDELTIETDRRHFYTDEFKNLVRDFYLQLK